MKPYRTVFFISDHTGVTAENMGKSLLNQFSEIDFECTTIPFINTLEQAELTLAKILSTTNASHPPIIISSIISQEIRNIFQQQSDILFFDVFETFVPKLEQALQVKAQMAVGMTHGMANEQRYDARIEAVNYALENDDGITDKNYAQADIILIGVSRSGKTPTCLYLALQYGIKAANYPLTPEDLQTTTLPTMLKPYREKLFGLTIESARLHQIRHERRANSPYASLQNCRFELQSAEAIYQQNHISHLNTTHKSIEELAASILQISRIKRRC